jgi:hypothetical protein
MKKFVLPVILFAHAAAVHGDPLPVTPPSVPLPSTVSSGQNISPDIAINGLFSWAQFSNSSPRSYGGHDPSFNGFMVQQFEMAFSGAVDPFLRADSNIVLTEEGEIEIEEAYAVTTGLPASLQIKAGQFFNAFGRHNSQHPHAWEFANKALVMGRVFGGDGLRQRGVQVSWLSPLPWYLEVIGSAQNATGETSASFLPTDGSTMRSAADLAALLKINQFFPLRDEWSLNFGLSYLGGPNETQSATTRIYGGDVYLRFRELDKLSFWTLQMEAIRRDLGAGVRDDGLYAQVIHRFDEPAQRWQAGLRYDLLGGSDFASESKRFRITPVVTYYPSEFSRLRVQYDYDKVEGEDRAQHAAIAQFEFLIGAHGAHKF